MDGAAAQPAEGAGNTVGKRYTDRDRFRRLPTDARHLGQKEFANSLLSFPPRVVSLRIRCAKSFSHPRMVLFVSQFDQEIAGFAGECLPLFAAPFTSPFSYAVLVNFYTGQNIFDIRFQL